MAILNVALVSRVIKRAIEESIKISSAWSPRPLPTVSLLPPDKLDEGSLGIYLYHVMEDPAFKNQPPVSSSSDPVPVRYTPMGLNLYYLITTDARADTETAMLDAQLLLGIAIKTLHDYPLFSDNTEINTVKLFEDVGIDKTDTYLKVIMQPTPYNEAVNYWTAGQSPLRLSAYYSVSVVLLEPEDPPSRRGRVLDYGVHTFVAGAPRLTSSYNTLNLNLPDGSTQEIELRPAEVPMGSRMQLAGVNLNSDDTRLLLANIRWDAPIAADFSWGVTATDDRLVATVQEQIDGTDILPGVYSAKVQLNESRIMPDGSTRVFTQTSNATPFVISPRIDVVGVPDVAGNVTITGFRFEHADIDAEDIQVFIDAEELTAWTAGPLAEGQYRITNATTLELRLPATVSSGFLAFRLIINGAESAPRWIENP